MSDNLPITQNQKPFFFISPMFKFEEDKHIISSETFTALCGEYRVTQLKANIITNVKHNPNDFVFDSRCCRKCFNLALESSLHLSPPRIKELKFNAVGNADILLLSGYFIYGVSEMEIINGVLTKFKCNGIISGR